LNPMPFTAGRSGSNYSNYQIRNFHATKKQEIIPLLGLLVVGFLGRYSYRAYVRMQEDWEDYEDALARYEAQYGKVKETADGTIVTLPTVGIHIGYSNVRVSYLNPPTIPTPQVVENREGARKTPSLVLFHNSNDGSTTVGQMAKSKMYDQTKGVVMNPMSVMAGANAMSADDQGTAKFAYEAIVRHAAYQALEKAMGADNDVNVSSNKQELGNGPLFGAASENSFQVQPVITYPMAFTNEETPVLPLFVDAMNTLTQNTLSSGDQKGGVQIELQFVSEPLAAVAAANKLGLLEKVDKQPSVPKDGPVLVLDLLASGLETSLVQMRKSPKDEDKVQYHADCVGLGVNTIVEGIAHLLVNDFYGDNSDSGTDSSKSQSQSASVSILEDLRARVQDDMALQRIMDAAEEAYQELSSSATGSTNSNYSSYRANVSIPYLSMDLQTRQPKHLNKGISASLMEQEATSLFLRHMGPILEASSPFGPPKTLTDAVTILLTKFLEDSQTTPFQLRAVLICGEGGRSPILRKAVSGALARIAGEPFVAERLIVPPVEQVEELVVLGAAFSAK
jgi:molecular chaperone DnaK (HSP70)